MGRGRGAGGHVPLHSHLCVAFSTVGPATGKVQVFHHCRRIPHGCHVEVAVQLLVAASLLTNEAKKKNM